MAELLYDLFFLQISPLPFENKEQRFVDTLSVFTVLLKASLLLLSVSSSLIKGVFESDPRL